LWSAHDAFTGARFLITAAVRRYVSIAAIINAVEWIEEHDLLPFKSTIVEASWDAPKRGS